MTFLGKLFVLVNVTLSAVLAFLAFGVYSGSIDWSDNPAKAGQPPGKIVAKKAEITELGQQLKLADDTRKMARAVVFSREEQRRGDREWYSRHLRDLYTGKGQVKIVAADKGLDAAGRPVMVDAEEAPGIPLMSLTVYSTRWQDLRAENARIRKDLEAKVKEDTDLTIQLTGDSEGKTKGMRRILAEERVKFAGVIDEQGVVEGLRVNTAVESELVLKRLETLNERLTELTKYLKMKSGVDGTGKSR
jgi:hypothetical protein